MKLTWSIALFVTASALLLAPLHLRAGDKDGPEKKEETKKQETKKPEAKDVIVNGELINADLKDKVRTGSACKSYTFKMVEGRTYQIDMISNVFDSYLRLENPEGQEVASDDDSGGFPHARITYRTPKTGDYQIVATSFAGGALGKFTLIVKDLNATGGKNVGGKAIELKNEKGQATYVGDLTANDTSYKRHKHHKLFLFAMEAGKTYQIDHAIRNQDAYLYLEDPDGILLAQNDDNGMSLDSRIIHKANKTGKYRIVATSLSGQNLGQFTLTIRQTDAAPPEEKKDGKKEEEKK